MLLRIRVNYYKNSSTLLKTIKFIFFLKVTIIENRYYCTLIITANNRTSNRAGNASERAKTKKDAEPPICSTFKNWGNKYSKQHGYISMTVCLFGIVANFLNILVLTRKEMNASPINKILAGKYMHIHLTLLDHIYDSIKVIIRK